jgi:glycine/D-amino acid oxidase-like deaminating enzyme
MDLYTGAPFWPIRDGLPATYPGLRRDETAEVVVIGAGITGALTAYELVQAGKDVLVLDRDDVAAGSTAASSGLLLYDTDTSLEDLASAVGPDAAGRVYALGLAAIDTLERLSHTLAPDCGFRRRPSLYLASRRRHVAALRREAEARSRLGLPVRWLTPQEIRAAYGFSSPGAIYSTGTGELDPYRFTHALLAAAQQAGARVYDRTAVTRITADAGTGITLELAGAHTVRADHVVCATGYDPSLLWRGSPGRPASTWAFVSEPLDDFTGWADRCLIWETARPYLYLRSTDDGRLMAGGEDEPYPFRHRRATTLAAKTARLVRRVRQMFPDLPIEPAFSWAGTFATTDDGLPFIGARENNHRLWFALGYGGNGITFSVIAANILRDALTGRDNPDAALFGFDRARRTPALV